MIDAFQRYGDYGSFLAGAPWTDKVRIVNGTRSRSNWLQAARMEFCSSLVLCHYSHVGPGSRTFGLECGTVISFWTPAADADTEEPPKLYGSAPNRWSSVVPAPSDHLGAERELPQGLHGNRHIDDATFPVDLVCFWVDGSDPAWNERKRQRLSGGLPDTSGAAISMEANEERLYRSRDELRYALRSVEMYAPFLRHVYLVTDRQVPDWLDPAAPGLTVIDHSEIFPHSALPVFNSNAIDTRVHHIDGLSEHFLVSNDDIMFFGPVTAADFFSPSGAARLFLSTARIPFGETTDGEPAVDSAAKNNRRLIELQYGVTITQKFKHIMSAQRRSVRFDVAKTFSEAVDNTTHHPFRSAEDIAFPHLCAYSGLMTGESIVGTLPYDYVSLADPRLVERLDALRRRPGKVRVLCLNDGDTSAVHDVHGRPIGNIVVDPVARDEKVAEFLETMFPAPSKWERETSTGTAPLDRALPTIERK